MEITLVHKYPSGQVAFSAGQIGGVQAPERRYNIVNHKVTLGGHHDDVLKSDVQELLNMPDGLYRMPTPAEQEAWTKTEQEANQIQESTKQGEQARKLEFVYTGSEPLITTTGSGFDQHGNATTVSLTYPAIPGNDSYSLNEEELGQDEESDESEKDDHDEDTNEPEEKEEAPTAPPAVQEKPKRHYNRKKK